MVDHMRTSQRGRARIRRMVAVVGCVALLAGCGANTGGGSGAGYLKGKTITLIAPDEPGGSYDAYARLFAPYLGKELGATIKVENVAGAGTVIGTNRLAAASATGLTIGMADVGADIASKIEHQPGQNFDLTKLEWIGQPTEIPNVVVTYPGSALQSFDSVLHSSNAVPVLDIRNSIGDVLDRVVLGAMHVPNNLATGFNDVSQLKQGLLAKDGQMLTESLPSMYSLIVGGQAKPLLYSGTVVLQKYKTALRDVPALESKLASMHLPADSAAAVSEAIALSNVSNDFAAPPGTPPATVAALRAAFDKAAASPDLQQQADKEGLQVSPIPGATVATNVDVAIKNANSISSYLTAS